MINYSEQLENPLVIIGSSCAERHVVLASGALSLGSYSAFLAAIQPRDKPCPPVSPAVNLKDSSAGVSVSLARGSEKNASNGLPSRNGCQFFSFSASWTGDTSMRTFAA
jgi:hypothetical protein